MQRICADIGEHRVTGRKQQGLTVCGKLRGDIAGDIQQRINALIVSGNQVNRIIGCDILHHLERHSVVNGDLSLRNQPGGIHSVEHIPEIVNRRGNLILTGIRTILGGENQDDVVLLSESIIGFGIFRAFLIAWQKPRDVLLIVKP